MIRISAVGDICLSNNNMEGKLNDLVPVFNKSDIVIGNLEGPIRSLENPINKPATCYSSEMGVSLLKKMGFNTFTLANNHMLDYGDKALINTLKILNDNDFTCFGAGVNLKEALKPAVKTINNKRIGFLGFGWDVVDCIIANNRHGGVAPLKKKLVLEAVRNLKNNCDFLIVSIHMGYEKEKYPLPFQRELCHRIIDEGCNLILGHHPHVVQGVEVYNNSTIVYSLGNFVFSDVKINNKKRPWDPSEQQSFIWQCLINDKLEMVENAFVPVCFSSNMMVNKVRESEAETFIKELEHLSEPLNLSDNAYYKYWKINRVRKLVNPNDNYYFTKLCNYILKIKQKLKLR